jgi:hypothetical protein
LPRRGNGSPRAWRSKKVRFRRRTRRFRRAVAIKKTPQILFPVGLCEAKTGALVSAGDLGRGNGQAEAIQVKDAARAELTALGPRLPKLTPVISSRLHRALAGRQELARCAPAANRRQRAAMKWSSGQAAP